MNINDQLKFDSFLKNFAFCRKQVNDAINCELDRHDQSVFYNSIKHALRGGKRLRPILLVSAYNTVRKEETNPMPAAAAIEFIHTGSLIQDDMIDRDSFRRGRPSLHISYGCEVSLLSTGFLSSVVSEIMNRYSNTLIYREITTAVASMCEAEYEEFCFCRKRRHLTLDRYISIVSRKTAVLFQASAAIGAMLGDATRDEIKILSDFGLGFGIAYQINDDIMDAMKNERNLLTLVTSKSQEQNNIQGMFERRISDVIISLDKLNENRGKEMLLGMAHMINTK